MGLLIKKSGKREYLTNIIIIVVYLYWEQKSTFGVLMQNKLKLYIIHVVNFNILIKFS